MNRVPAPCFDLEQSQETKRLCKNRLREGGLYWKNSWGSWRPHRMGMSELWLWYKNLQCSLKDWKMPSSPAPSEMLSPSRILSCVYLHLTSSQFCKPASLAFTECCLLSQQLRISSFACRLSWTFIDRNAWHSGIRRQSQHRRQKQVDLCDEVVPSTPPLTTPTTGQELTWLSCSPAEKIPCRQFWRTASEPRPRTVWKTVGPIRSPGSSWLPPKLMRGCISQTF